jgi:DNA modification methylase
MGLLHLGDNLPFLWTLAPGSVQLVYADPPFGTNRDRLGEVGGFGDRWASPEEYVEWLRPRIEAIHRVLAESGSLYLHLDRRSVHHARLLLDDVFGRRLFGNEIIWHYTGGGRGSRGFPHKHDNILVYHKGPGHKFNADAVREPYTPSSGYARGGIRARSGKLYRPHPSGRLMDDVWSIPMINPLSPERTGYPTQKPEALLARILLASADPNDVVLDPFCGSGTTPAVAHKLGRAWIAVDSSPAAIETTRSRLQALGAEVTLTGCCGRDDP